MNCVIHRWAIAVAMVSVGLGLVAQRPSGQTARNADELKLRLNEKAPGWLKENDVPSVAVAYIANGQVAWTAVYGEQSEGVAATEKTLYNVASLTKPVTAEMILRLASKGRMSLDEPIAAYWVDPDLKENPWNKLLTPRLCLSHQTGFKNWRYQTDGVLKFEWEPGTKTGYSGEGYNYVGRFAEKKMKEPFETLVQEYVFDPIGMKDTALTEHTWYAGRLAMPHGTKDESGSKEPVTWNAADRLRTTVGDYAKFVVSVMRKDALTPEIGREQFVSTRNQATEEQLSKLCESVKVSAEHCNGTAGLGLGWQILSLDGETIIDHSGSDPGVHTLAFFVPGTNIGAVVFTNGENGEKVIREVVRLLYPNALFVGTI